MLKVLLHFVGIALLMSFVVVFVIQWGKGIVKSIKEKSVYSVALALVSLGAAVVGGKIGYLALSQYLDNVPETATVILAGLILGISQAIWENYNALQGWLVRLGKKVVEKKAENL